LYYEISSDGKVRRYPAIGLNQSELLTGLALTDDGGTFVSTSDMKNRTWRLLSIVSPEEQWTAQFLPAYLEKALLYGGEGRQLVFLPRDHLKISFVNVSRK